MAMATMRENFTGTGARALGPNHRKAQRRRALEDPAAYPAAKNLALIALAVG
jgi:hypothetical protein